MPRLRHSKRVINVKEEDPHEKNATHWNKCKHVGSALLSECSMQLATNFRSALCAGFLYQLMLFAIGWCWNKSSWVVPIQVSGCVALCSTVMFSSSPWWPCTVTRSCPPTLAASWGIPSFHPCQVCGIYHVALRHRNIWVFSFQPSGMAGTQTEHFGLCEQSSGR